MNQLLVFADIHGSYNAWLTIQALLSDRNGLAVAGDLFDTRYGSYGNSDFQPAQIRSDLKDLSSPFYYVYGNCDVASFFPGYDTALEFQAFGRSVYLHHGHRPLPADCPADIVIQGHTHLCGLEKAGSQIFLNPGSIALPRNSLPTYGVIDETGVRLIHLTTGEALVSISF